MVSATVILITSIVLLVITVILLIILGITKMKTSPEFNPQAACHSLTPTGGAWLWTENCDGFEDFGPDPTGTVQVPSLSGVQSGVLKFDKGGVASPFYRGVWYRFKLIDLETGFSGEPSEWLGPIQSGASSIPYFPNNQGKTGTDTCGFNLLTIAIPTSSVSFPVMTKPYDGKDSYYGVNVYRYDSPNSTEISNPADDPTITGELVGYLVPSNGYYAFIDTKGPCWSVACEKSSACANY